MTLTLVRKLLRDVRWPLLVVWIILFIFSMLWVNIAQRVTTRIYPFFNIIGLASNLPDLKASMEKIVMEGPGQVAQAVLGGSGIKFEVPEHFLAVELLHPVVIILTSLWGVGRSAGAVAGEIDRGTMELLMSQPVPRNRLILAHFLADLIVIPIICSSLYVGLHTGLALAGPFKVDYSVEESLPKGAQAMMKKLDRKEVLEVNVERQKYAILNTGALIFAISGITIAVSSLGRNRWRSTAWAVLIILGMFIINVIGQLWDAVAFLRPFTVFFYYQPQNIWLYGNWSVDLGDAWNGGKPILAVPMVLVLLATGAIGYLIALRVFTRRDLPAPL